jgi:putative drug exporter of the RND superfamily
MFERLGRFVVYRRWWVIAAWLVAAVALGAFAPSLSDATTQDQADFLPDRYESVQATTLAQQAFGQADGATGTIVVKRDDGGPLTAADQATVARMTRP